MDLCELFRGGETRIGGILYHSPQYYLRPFISFIGNGCILSVDAVESSYGGIDYHIYNRVHVRAAVGSDVFGMIYILDSSKPMMKFYRGFEYDNTLFLTGSGYLRVLPISGEYSIDLPEIFSRDDFLHRLSVTVDIDKSLGGWIRRNRGSIFFNGIMDVKLSASFILDIFYQFEGRVSLLDIYKRCSYYLVSRSNDIVNVPEKLLLIKQILHI